MMERKEERERGRRERKDGRALSGSNFFRLPPTCRHRPVIGRAASLTAFFHFPFSIFPFFPFSLKDRLQLLTCRSSQVCISISYVYVLQTVVTV